MAGNIYHVEVRNRSLTPAKAELSLNVYIDALSPMMEVRGRLMGPSCPFASTVEVAYPLRRTHDPLTLKVVIPEPSLWEPESPFLYHGTVELWEHSERCDQATVRHGLCTSSLTPRGLRWNGKPLPLRGRAVRGLTDETALQLRGEGFNLLLAPLDEPQTWEIADRLGFVVIGTAGALDDNAVSQMRRLVGHPSLLGFLLDTPPTQSLPDDLVIGVRDAEVKGSAFVACPAIQATVAHGNLPVLVIGETKITPPVMGCVL